MNFHSTDRFWLDWLIFIIWKLFITVMIFHHIEEFSSNNWVFITPLRSYQYISKRILQISKIPQFNLNPNCSWTWPNSASACSILRTLGVNRYWANKFENGFHSKSGNKILQVATMLENASNMRVRIIENRVMWMLAFPCAKLCNWNNFVLMPFYFFLFLFSVTKPQLFGMSGYLSSSIFAGLLKSSEDAEFSISQIYNHSKSTRYCKIHKVLL